MTRHIAMILDRFKHLTGRIFFLTGTKLGLALGMLLCMVFFATFYTLIQQQHLSDALQGRDEMRAQANAIADIAADMDELIILHSEMMLSGTTDAREQFLKDSASVLETMRTFGLAGSADLPAAALFLEKAGRDLDPKDAAARFTYLRQARASVEKTHNDFKLRIEAGRQKIRAMVEKRPHDNFLFFFAILVLLVASSYVLIYEIFLPMRKTTLQLLKASGDIDNIQAYKIAAVRRDELGRAQHGLNLLFTHVDESLQRIRDANTRAATRLAAIEAIKDGVGLVDANGLLTYGNRALFEIHGVDAGRAGEYLHQPWLNLYNERGRDFISRVAIPELWDKGHWIGETSLVRADGKVRKTEMSLTLLDDGSIIGTARDITQRKQAEAEREEFQQLFLHSQKMEAVGRLTGGVAHDFNNILAVISGNLEFLREADGLEQIEKHIATALRATGRGAELTQRLLSFSRKQMLAPRVVDINVLLAETVMFLTSAMGRKIDIEFSTAPDVWAVRLDTGQFENALLNLVINARDAMAGGGTIRIVTENAYLDMHGQDQQADIILGEYVCVSVRDDGAGIAPGIVDKVFDPFFTTKADGKGTGLGLSMVYGFVKQSGGHVIIESEPGNGTTVRLYFPRHAQEASQSPAAEGPASAPRPAVRTVLVVDDEIELLEVARARFEKLGYRVVMAANGDEALAKMELPSAIDLLVSDIVMPGTINGRTLMERARAKRPELKILLVSGYASEDGKDFIRDARTRFLAKPYTQGALRHELDILFGLDVRSEAECIIS